MSDTIIKVSNKTENFTVVTNEVARRNDLSARAKGIYFYLMTLPKDWKLFREELNTHFTEGKDALNTAFKELENAGYISKKRVLDKTKFAGWEYSIYETSTINGKPDSGNPKTDYPCTGNPQLLSTNSLLSTNQQRTDNKEDTPEIPAITSKPKRLEICNEIKDVANMIVSLHKEHTDPGYNPDSKQIEGWYGDIEKLHRLDGRSYVDIKAALYWAKAVSTFWPSNIMSGAKLRKQFDTIWAQMKQGKQSYSKPIIDRSGGYKLPEGMDELPGEMQ